MNKCIILSVQPQWLHKILIGKKTIEIRKSMPKDCEYPIDVYLYCTKGKNDLRVFNESVCKSFNIPRVYLYTSSEKKGYTRFIVDESQSVNGKIVAKFTLNKVESFDGFDIIMLEDLRHMFYGSCLTTKQIKDYSDGKDLYGWNIDNLEIFKKPMELREFYRNCDDFVDARPCNCGKHCEYEGYDLQENCSICTIDYDGSACPFLKVQRPPQSWCYAYKK